MLFPTSSDTYRLANSLKHVIEDLHGEGVLTPEILILLANNFIYDRFGGDSIGLKRHLVACLAHEQGNQLRDPFP